MTLCNEYADNINKPRVLVVDDDPALRFYARQVLESHGYDIHEARDGMQALELVGKTDFDAIMVDVRMPGMDGYSTCSELRKILSGEFLPIIIVTGQDSRDAIDKAFQSGATDFATKPVHWVKLKQRLSYLINARRMSKDLLSRDSYHKALIDTIPDTLLSLDANGIVLDVKSSADAFDVSSIKLDPGKCFHDLLPQDAAIYSREAIVSVLSGGGPSQFEFEIEREGSAFFFDVRMVATGDGKLLAMLRDFTERQRTEKEIRSLAYYDQVTGLPNQELMRKEIATLVSGPETHRDMLSVIRINMLGLDYARSVLGIERSNELLNIITQRLQNTLNNPNGIASDTRPVIGRVSESGFAIICNDSSGKEEMYNFAKALQQHMEEKFMLGEYELSFASRVGAAMYQNDEHDNDLLGQAGIALEHANKYGQDDKIFYTAEMHKRTASRARMSGDLRLALENKELYLVYQPKVDALTRELIGVEALLRWDSCERGPISPAEFIPVAEESDLILALGEYVLDEACRQSRRWIDAGCREIPIAVNFSGHQFNQRGLVENIVKTLGNHNIGSNHIEIELTESVALTNSAKVQSILGELQELGIKTAIDDFGTGFSSLSSLRKFPFDTLKIDRSFIMDMNQTDNSGSVIEGIINMAHAMNMKVVAEGVEEEHHLDFLRNKNCDVIQGYLTGRPGPAKTIQDMLSPEFPPITLAV